MRYIVLVLATIPGLILCPFFLAGFVAGLVGKAAAAGFARAYGLYLELTFPSGRHVRLG